MNTRTMAQNSRWMHLEQTVMRGAIWAFVGVVFGFIFVVLSVYLEERISTPLLLLGATAGAGGLTALFYGSMRLSVMVANFVFIAMVFYTWGNAQLTLEPLMYIGGIVGLVVGAIYGAKDKKSRVYCAEAKVVAGIFAGVLASTLGMLLAMFVDVPVTTWAAMVVGPVGALIYVSSASWFVDRCHRFLPPVVDGALVGLGVGSTTGLLFMFMAGSLDQGLLATPYHVSLVERVQATWMVAVSGAAAACFLVGVLRSLFRVRWYNL